ncbi:MAG: hypothetical protein ABGZ17_20895 [Planctomycetaceae bacterium]
MKWIVLATQCLVCSSMYAQVQRPNAGSWSADQLPHRAVPSWSQVSGTGREAIEDGVWLVRSPTNFVRRLSFGPSARTRGQKYEVEFVWGTDCRNNMAADGFSLHTQGRRLRLHPIHRPGGRDLLLQGTPAGMSPDRTMCHVDLSALPQFDASALNRYRIRWVTSADDDYGFELHVNGRRVGILAGEFVPRVRELSLAFEFRSGRQSVDEVTWRLRVGGQPAKSRYAEQAAKMAADGYRQLFLDDVHIHKTTRLRRVLHQPVKYAGNPVIRHHQKPWQHFRAQLYGTVLYDAQEKIFKMWYLAGPRFPDEKPIRINGRIRPPNLQLLAYAESKDGFHWKLPELGLVSFNGSRRNNICRFSRENAEGVAVVYDPQDPDPRRRYKAFYWEHSHRGVQDIEPLVNVSGMSVSFSADGKRWIDYPGNPVLGLASDTGHQAVWDPLLNKYVAFGRFGAGGRRVARADSDDFIVWSSPRLVFSADAEDGLGTQCYGMGITRYEGVYIGLPWMFREGTTNRIDVQLAASRDGLQWQRVADRGVFISNGPRGSWDGGCIFTAAQPLQVVGDRVFIFYSALMLDHEERRPSRAQEPGYGESSIGVATLRRDGFVSLRADQTNGSLITEPFVWKAGRSLHLNVDARQGQIQVAVLDQHGKPIAGWETSDAVVGDHTDVVVRWPSRPESNTDRLLSLQLTLRQTDLYAYWLK